MKDGGSQTHDALDDCYDLKEVLTEIILIIDIILFFYLSSFSFLLIIDIILFFPLNRLVLH